MYDGCAHAFRCGETVLHSFATFTQLASVEGSTLRAPAGQQDERVDASALALVAAVKARRESVDEDADPEVLGGGYRRAW